MFTKLYLDSTNPKLTLSQLFSENILHIMMSVVFHTIVYALFFNMASYIFMGSFLSNRTNMRMILALVLIMFFGYIGRFYHVKDIYNAYNGDMDKVRNHLDKLYITWVFVA